MARSEWEPVIGLEIHVQLATKSKIFSAASTAFGAPPNTHIEPVSLGMPGVLPVLNREVVELAIRLGLGLGCEIARSSRFSRKHYFYPDLPKGYQITQYEQPICTGGSITCDVDGETKVFRLHRIHLEEDAGKSVHDAKRGCSMVDFNRAGTPLCETVSEADMRSPADAVAYMKAMHQIVVALGVCDGNLEQGSFRCDANVSVRRGPDAPFGTKVELKNINSFRFVGKALEYEVERQIEELEAGGQIYQETRLWDDAAGRTRVMRTKEGEADYRYFPEPDLMPLEIDEAWIARIGAALPELPRQRRERFERQLELPPYDADVLTQSSARADYFEAILGAGDIDPKVASNWVLGELLGRLNRVGDKDIEDSPVPPEALSELLGLVAKGTISSKMAKKCFVAMFDDGVAPGAWVKQHGGQITDPAEVEALVRSIVEANPGEVAAYLGGKGKVLGFFVGQVMKASRGKANPQLVNEVVKRLLEEQRR